MGGNHCLNLLFLAVKTMEEAIDRHVNDSLTLIPIIEDYFSRDELSVVDVGSGAGLPGAILAMMKDLWRVGDGYQ